MAIIPGVEVNWPLSPRVITIPSTETSITIEDYQDTLLDLEDSPEGMVHPHLRNTSGGEDLGGGVTVGWTMEMQNAVTAPAPRTTSVSEGTVTTPDSGGTVLFDSSATFESDGVEPGAHVVNFTDKSVTSVISVDSEQQLTVYPLDDGSDNQWDSADAYKVWNVEQFEITGGNNVAVDDVGAPISPIRSTWGNQIIKTSSSSATISEQTSIQYSSFNEGVTVDVVNGTSGTEFPQGTGLAPVDNIPDAITIADDRGFKKIYIKGDITLDTGDDISNKNIYGEDYIHSTITINPGADVTNSSFHAATVTGTLDGGNVLEDCLVQTLNYVNGTIINCLLGEYTITLGGASVANFLDCWSGVPGTNAPTIDMGGSGQDLSLRAYAGGIKITNCSAAQNVSIDLIAGTVTLDNTITAGTFKIRGVGDLNDNSTGTTINKDGFVEGEVVQDARAKAKMAWINTL